MSGRLKRQFGLSDLILLIVTVGVWAAYFANQSQLTAMGNRVESMRRIAGVLSIEDPKGYQAIAVACMRYPDEAWRVFLPEGWNHTLHFGSRGIRGNGFTSDNEKTIGLPAGTSKVYLRQMQLSEGGRRFAIEVDDEVALTIDEPENWDLGSGSSSVGIGKRQELKPLGTPLVLKRQRNHSKEDNGSSPDGEESVTGLFLWITSERP